MRDEAGADTVVYTRPRLNGFVPICAEEFSTAYDAPDEAGFLAKLQTYLKIGSGIKATLARDLRCFVVTSNFPERELGE